MPERSGRVKFDDKGEMRVKGDARDTSRTGGTDIQTKGLRYSKAGGGTRRSPREQDEWRCPDCGHMNERYLIQCRRCGWHRTKQRPSLERT